MVCLACERNAWKLEGLETDLRVKQRVRLSLKTTIDLYGKHKDDGTLPPADQINLNDAVERLPEVERQIRELEAKVRDARTALDKCVTDKCTDKPVATDTPTGKTEQRKTEERKTEERKTEERKTEQRKTEQRKTEERKTEERKTEERRTPKKETGRTALKSGEDRTMSVPRISVTIGLGGSPDRGHRENHHPGGGDGGGRGGGGFGFGGSSPGALSFGR
jgi:hypothetical protein